MLYSADEIRHNFGDLYCGPDEIPHDEWTLIVDAGDVSPVQVFVRATPARFYKVVVLETPFRQPAVFTTGSGQDAWVAQTVRMILDDMLVFRDEEI